MTQKEVENNKKTENVLNKEFHNLNKNEEIDIKTMETNAKLNETKGKMGEKVVKKPLLDNSTKKGKIIRGLIVLIFIGLLVLGGYLALKYTGVLDKFNSLEDVKNFILSGGNWSVLVFVIIQFLQVTFLPIPAFITTVAGAIIFGAWTSFIMSFIAIMIGSIFAFYLGRKFGKSVLVWIAGKEDAEKWTRKLTNGKYVFFLMMLFPIFPDDILCMAAGVTNMSFNFFFFTNLITRPIAIFCTCFLGSGTLIPFKGYGLAIWAVLIILLIVAFILSIKYKDKIENLVDKIAFKNKNKKASTSGVKIETLPLTDGNEQNTSNNTNKTNPENK